MRLRGEWGDGHVWSVLEDRVDISFRIPGTTEPEITVRRSALGSIKVFVDGTPARRRHRRRLSYDIPLSDGTVTELRLTGQWTNLKADINGVQTVLEPPVPRFAVILTFLPLALVLLGGLIGGLIGVGAAAINGRLARRQMPLPIKVISMLGVIALSVALYLGAAFAIAPIPTLETGTCVNGIRPSADMTASATRPVDCTKPHDNEVVGTLRHDGQGGYPGTAALETFAAAGCIAAFNAYVGGDFQSSTLQMLPFMPDELSWAKGARDISCVVLAGDGTQLTGSVKGTAR
jgi:hypothetical protein